MNAGQVTGPTTTQQVSLLEETTCPSGESARIGTVCKACSHMHVRRLSVSIQVSLVDIRMPSNYTISIEDITNINHT